MLRAVFALGALFAIAVDPRAAGQERRPDPVRGGTAERRLPARGLAFAVSLKGSGQVLHAGPFLLRVPGSAGLLRLELARLSVDGASLRGEARLRNESSVLLSGLELEFDSASPTRRDPSGKTVTTSTPASLREPLAFGELLPGETAAYQPFDLAPLPLGEDFVLTILMGSVTGLAVESPLVVEGADRPVALDSDRSGRIYVATAGVGRVLRLTASSAASPAEAARPSAPPTGFALRRRTNDLLVATGGATVEVHRPGRARPATLDAGRPVSLLRIDAKGVLRAASGNGVLAFDEAKAGHPAPLGPAGSEVVSFDTDSRGTIHAVVRQEDALRLVVGGASGPAPFVALRGSGSDALAAPRALRFADDGALWVASSAATPEGACLTRFAPDGTPLGTLPRLGLALALGKDEETAVPAAVDLASGPDGRLWVLLESGALFAVRPL